MMNSIKSKLLAGGAVLLLLPIILISTMSTVKSYSSIEKISSSQLRDISDNMAESVSKIYEIEATIAKSIAADIEIKESMVKVNKMGEDEHGSEVKDLFNRLRLKFDVMGDNYQGIFVTDKDGFLFTGILDNGKEYRGANIKKRPYFSKVKNSGEVIISDIVRSKTTRKLISVICVPVFTGEKEFLGVVGLVMKVDFLIDLISKRKIGKTGYSYMINNNGLALAHPIPQNILKMNIKKLNGMESASKKIISSEKGIVDYAFNGIEKTAGFAKVPDFHWSIITTQDNDELFASSRSIRNNSLIITLVTIIIVFFATILGARKIVGPIKEAVEGLKEIANGEGDLTKRLVSKSKDEVGELTFWFNSFMETLQNLIKHIKENSENVRTAADNLSDISSEMTRDAKTTSDRSNSVAAATEEMNTNINSVAAAMEQSSSNLDMVASAAEEMTSTISEIATNTDNAKKYSTRAVSTAKEVSGKVKNLDEASKQINKVTETINEISEQTNLLALNATIEAARAGEAGKGFAVVANEIKELAKQTAFATQNIKSQIEGIQSTTSSAVENIGDITNVIGDMNEIVVQIASAIEEQSIVTKEIAGNINSASSGIQEVNDNIIQSSTVSNEISMDISEVTVAVTDISNSSTNVLKNSGSLLKMSEELSNMVGRFRV